MMIKKDVLGYRYNDEQSPFVELEGGWYYHLQEKKRYEKIAFDAWLAAEGLSFGVGELGWPTQEYIDNHEYMLQAIKETEGSMPIDALVTKIPAGVDDTGIITITGGFANKPYTVTVISKDSTSGESVLEEFSIETGMTITDVGDLLANGGDPNLLSVVNTAGVITYTPSGLGSIDVLNVSVVVT